MHSQNNTEPQLEQTVNLQKPSEAARQIGITTDTLHVWRRKGYVLAVELPNGHYGIPASEVERLKGGH